MKHAHIETPEGSYLVRADGTEPPQREADRPMLHLLAQLFVSLETLVISRFLRVRCTLTILNPAGRIDGPREVIVRQPLPNERYFVAGTLDSRYGLMFALPRDIPEEIAILLQWLFTDASQAQAVRVLSEDGAAVDHLLRLRLRPSERGQVFSTDTSAWPDAVAGAALPDRGSPYAVLSTHSLPAERQESAILSWNGPGDVLLIEERLEVPGILLSDTWGLDEFEDEQLHEVQHIAQYDPDPPDTVAHRANACLEMPPEVLVQACRLARDVPYGSGTIYDGSMAATECHPALIKLCDWWNLNALDPLHRRAGLFSIEVRVRDDGEYWNAYYETPNTPVSYQAGLSPAARIGDVVLIRFFQSQHNAGFEEDGCTLYDVDGGPWQTIGVPEEDVRSGEADEGWYLLQGLASFPHRFPAAWRWLCGHHPSRSRRSAR